MNAANPSTGYNPVETTFLTASPCDVVAAGAASAVLVPEPDGEALSEPVAGFGRLTVTAGATFAASIASGKPYMLMPPFWNLFW